MHTLKWKSSIFIKKINGPIENDQMYKKFEYLEEQNPVH